MAREKKAKEVAEKWSRSLGAAVPDIRAGVEAVSENPCDQAADAVDEWVAGVTAPTAKEKFVAGLRRTSLAEWKAKFLNKGLARVASGAAEAEPKMESFMDAFLPFVYKVRDDAKRDHPGVTLEAGIARATDVMRGNAGFKW